MWLCGAAVTEGKEVTLHTVRLVLSDPVGGVLVESLERKETPAGD